MLYAILCYADEAAVAAWTPEEDAACMGRLAVVHEGLAQAGRLGPVARLLPTTVATTLRRGREDGEDGRNENRRSGLHGRLRSPLPDVRVLRGLA